MKVLSSEAKIPQQKHLWEAMEEVDVSQGVEIILDDLFSKTVNGEHLEDVITENWIDLESLLLELDRDQAKKDVELHEKNTGMCFIFILYIIYMKF